MKSAYILILIIAVFILNAFTLENPYFSINEQDVEFNSPKNFPKVVYDFNKNKVTPQGFLLGRKLFYDPILSKDNFTSCSTCHQRFAAFAHVDHPLSHGILGQIGKRNVPALQNLVWKKEFMADGGINNLDLQPIAPITNAIEMGESLENVLQKLRRDTLYPKLFQRAFGDTAISSERLLKSLSQFLSLMVSNNSRYDKYLAGQEKFTGKEEHGLKLFRAHCTSCHKEPMLSDYSYRNIGLKPDTTLNDSGRASITRNPKDFMKFQVPGLRNIEMTYPYMHDGRFKNLEEVIDHYADGDFFTDNVDPLIRKIPAFTQEERTDIVIFLRTLTDKTFLYDRRFIDPNIAGQKLE
jgi:cytochrome c peroxidase